MNKTFTKVYDSLMDPLYVGDNVTLFGMTGEVTFECGAFGIVFPHIDWDLIESKIKEVTGCDNEPCFCYNDNFISFWELLWNFNCEDNVCCVIDIAPPKVEKSADGIELYTTYFAALKRLPEDVTPVSICLKAPEGYKGLQYKKLAPSWDILKSWKETPNEELYIARFEKMILSGLDAKEVVQELMSLTGNKKMALVCYEKPDDFCHRHLVAKWLAENGYPCNEFER